MKPIGFCEQRALAASLLKIKHKTRGSNDKTIIDLGYRLRLRQIIDQLGTDKSRYFAQPRPTE